MASEAIGHLQDLLAEQRAINNALDLQIELQQTTNRLLAKLLDQRDLAESRQLAVMDELMRKPVVR